MTVPISVEQARQHVLSMVRVLDSERISLSESLGRVLAEDALSDIDVAPFDNSAMDGFAVRAADLALASPGRHMTLDVIADIPAGTWWDGRVGPGQAARIMTGAPVPSGADAVVMVEFTEKLSGDGGVHSRVAFSHAPETGEHIRRRGEEVSRGHVVVAAGERIGPATVGLLAATGHASLAVVRAPRVAVLSTGNELVEIDQRPGLGKIRNSNSYSLAAQVQAAGGIALRYGIVPDDFSATCAAFAQAAAEADYIVTSGGVSVGEFDFIKPTLEKIGRLEFHQVAMRPGAPQTMGSVNGVPVFGLPGNPTSSFVGFEIFVRPALRKMQGLAELDRPKVTATLLHDVRKKPGRRYYLRGRLAAAQGGAGLSVELSGSQSSALLAAAHRGNCFIMLEQGESSFPAGTQVECLRLDVEEGVAL